MLYLEKMTQEVLSLYRAILRLGRTKLTLTDPRYFRKLVGAEFRSNSRETCPQEVEFQLKVSFDIIIETVCHLSCFSESLALLKYWTGWHEVANQANHAVLVHLITPMNLY